MRVSGENHLQLAVDHSLIIPVGSHFAPSHVVVEAHGQFPYSAFPVSPGVQFEFVADWYRVQSGIDLKQFLERYSLLSRT